jgi:hypothetical protein
MTSSGDNERRQIITQERAEQLLRKAIEIDAAEQNSVTVSELHAIAKELGISPMAVEKALMNDALNVPAAVVEEPKSILRDRLFGPVVMYMTGVGLVLGTLALGINGPPAIATAYLALAYFASKQRRDGRFKRVVLGAFAVWAGALTALAGVRPMDADIGRGIYHMIMSIGVTTALMVAYDAVRKGWTGATPTAPGARGPGDGPGGGPGSRGPRESLWLRSLKRISRWMGDGPVQRSIVVLRRSLRRGSQRRVTDASGLERAENPPLAPVG